MINNSTSHLSQLHPEPTQASLMPIDDNNVVSIHSGQAKASKFYSDANTFFTAEEDLYEEMPYKEYYDLEGGAEEDKYIFSLSMHLTDTNE